MEDNLIKIECSESQLRSIIKSVFSEYLQDQTVPTPVMPLKRQVRTKEARKILDVSPPTINRYRKKDWISSVMRGGKRMYDYNSLINFLENPPSDFK